MLADPLHPALVHLPLALAFLMPLAAAGLAPAIRGGAIPLRAWTLVVALGLLLLGSGWAALETGERQEERVEEVVGEVRIEQHERAAERLLWTAAAATAVAGVGLSRSRFGGWARGFAVLASLGVFGAALAAGHSGGELVYRYGAARAYATGPGSAGGGEAATVAGDDGRRLFGEEGAGEPGEREPEGDRDHDER